jgi:hypothetical protein
MERVLRLTGRGIVSYITNRRWLTGRSYPAMRESIVHSFDILIIDDLHGSYSSKDSDGGVDESIFKTETAPGIKVGTAIVTGIYTGAGDSKVEPAIIVGRDFKGTAASKRERLSDRAGGAVDIDIGLLTRPTSELDWWRLAGGERGEYPGLDDYFDFNLSGVQTIRDDAVLDSERARLEYRFRDYFDPSIDWDTIVERYPGFDVHRSRYDGPRVRSRLLDKSAFHDERIVRFLFKPFDARWLYWEPKHKLLNEARVELMPYYLGITGQRAIVLPQIRNRPGAARPMVVTQVPSYKSAFEDARVFPLWVPAVSIGLTPGELGEPGLATRRPNIAPRWIAAAQNAGTPGDAAEIAEVVFFALAGVCASSSWLATQPLQSEDFPQVPLPGDAKMLLVASELGRRVADLTDPDQPVAGVTVGVIDTRYASVAVPDASPATVYLLYGTAGTDGGLWQGGSVYWDETHAWRNVPEEVWNYGVSGFRPLPKWLSYRIGVPLAASDREAFTHLARRIAALLDCAPDADDVFDAAKASPLDVIPSAITC